MGHEPGHARWSAGPETVDFRIIAEAPDERGRGFHQNPTVKPVAGTLIDISYLNPDPNLAANVVNHLTRVLANYNFQTRHDANAQTADRLGQLADLRKQSEDLQAKVAQVQRESGVFTLGGVDATGKVQVYHCPGQTTAGDLESSIRTLTQPDWQAENHAETNLSCQRSLIGIQKTFSVLLDNFAIWAVAGLVMLLRFPLIVDRPARPPLQPMVNRLLFILLYFIVCEYAGTVLSPVFAFRLERYGGGSVIYRHGYFAAERIYLCFGNSLSLTFRNRRCGDLRVWECPVGTSAAVNGQKAPPRKR